MPYDHARIADTIHDMISKEGASKEMIANFLASVYKEREVKGGTDDNS